MDSSCFISFCYKIFIVCKTKSYEHCVLYLLLPVRKVKIVKKDSVMALCGRVTLLVMDTWEGGGKRFHTSVLPCFRLDSALQRPEM